MRCAAARAAMRRGSSMMIFRPSAQPSFRSTSGTRVVLPAPGGATRTALAPAESASRNSPRTASMGSGGAKICMGAVMAVWRPADKTEGLRRSQATPKRRRASISPAVDESRPVVERFASATIGVSFTASSLPSSTPHWS